MPPNVIHGDNESPARREGIYVIAGELESIKAPVEKEAALDMGAESAHRHGKESAAEEASSTSMSLTWINKSRLDYDEESSGEFRFKMMKSHLRNSDSSLGDILIEEGDREKGARLVLNAETRDEDNEELVQEKG
ncbi:uncharacterized protein A4U43_C05F9770 [Asparagus officinalis]|uniref:Uncharacterized protein n=1 Tax=Asparagus officinalis TaxID=4686 RepID=A0A5P1EQT6_ASPOF|nr:uncharacterized protein A4U43_C05F9770 [Asparagus officinalis]